MQISSNTLVFFPAFAFIGLPYPSFVGLTCYFYCLLIYSYRESTLKDFLSVTSFQFISFHWDFYVFLDLVSSSTHFIALILVFADISECLLIL